ncbi:S26 family signal peptidase [Streptomyces sp. NPDC053367]|uniref:S26 family signal peptidase n=1 Tax=Streptomyces sp. NPDC053367 TaxID=3365700 RepID=UPI0037D74F58
MRRLLAAVVVGLGGSTAVLLTTALAAARRRIRVTVEGHSMEPALTAGETAVAHRTRRPARLRAGQVVVMVKPTAPGSWRWPPVTRRPHRQALLVKRLAALPGDLLPPGVPGHRAGQVTVPDGYGVVLGDNLGASTDSRTFGLVPLDRIVAHLPGRDT